MIREQDGMELMLSRYREAQRRLEAAAEETEKLRKKLEQEKPGDPASEETKRELKQLAKRMKEEAAAMRELSDHKLPYSLDQRLSSELNKAAQMPEEAAEEIEKMLQEGDMHNEALERQLGKMKKQLAQERQAYEEQAMQPMELLASIVPLKADEERFLMLVMHQKDLAERLASFKGRDHEDNPALKARMRELEEEQRKVREMLASLLTDIEENAKKLPDDPRLEKLRDTALQFVQDVRDSGASEAMSEAEAGLAEYSGTTGYVKAKEAAEILEEFLKKCNGMGQQAEDSLDDPVFQPGMGNCMKQTLGQLLGEMGFGKGGSGWGNGRGGGRGRGFGQNMGLYGGLPGMGQAMMPSGSGQGKKDEQGKGGSLGGSNPDLDRNYEIAPEGNVSGAGESSIPLRYRRQIGRYFERIAEENEEK
jgi:hypothetical protein